MLPGMPFPTSPEEFRRRLLDMVNYAAASAINDGWDVLALVTLKDGRCQVEAVGPVPCPHCLAAVLARIGSQALARHPSCSIPHSLAAAAAAAASVSPPPN